MNLVWIGNVRRAFAAVYGEKRGPAACSAVIPGVMGDFRRMLTAAAEGAVVRETYRTDDGKMELHLEGRREAGALLLTKLTVGGQPVDLGEDELTL